MNFEERMEELQNEIRAGWTRNGELAAEQERLVDEHLGQPCGFCQEGTIRARAYHRPGTWHIFCDECGVCTPYTDTFAQALRYWNALLATKQELDDGSR